MTVLQQGILCDRGRICTIIYIISLITRIGSKVFFHITGKIVKKILQGSAECAVTYKAWAYYVFQL